MKKIIYYTFMLVVASSLSSCLKDMKDSELFEGAKEIVVDISLPEALASESREGFSVTLRNIKTGASYVLKTDADGVASIEAEYGSYTILVSKDIEVDGVIKYLRSTQNVILNKDGNEALKATADIKVSNKGTIILKEAYFHKSKTPANASYIYDQYFSLYNNSDKVQYLDGIGLGFTNQTTSGATGWYVKDWIEGSVEPRDSVALYPIGFVFPGKGQEYPMEPGEEVVVAFSAINHTSAMTTTPIDLSADNVWAMYSDDLKAQKVPAPGVKRMQKYYKFGTATMVVVGQLNAACVLYRIEGDPVEYVAEGPVSGRPYGNVMYKPTAYTSNAAIMIPKEWVYDGVEFRNNAAHVARLCPEISLQPMTISTAAYTGISYIRKVDETATAAAGHTIYQDTNDSSEDWMMINKPTLCTK